MSGMNLIKRLAIVTALMAVTASMGFGMWGAGNGAPAQSAAIVAPASHAGVQVAQKQSSDGQETHG